MPNARTTPPSKKPAARAAAPKATFSFAAAQKEWDDTEKVAPFTVELPDGEVVTLKDLGDVPWQVAASIDPKTPFLFMNAVVEEDDYDKFVEQKVPLRFLEQMLIAWREHYQVPDPGN